MTTSISVILPVFNAASKLHASIDSVLNQTFCDFELIIVDDGSVDDSLSVIELFKDSRIRVLRLDKNHGLIYALNIAINLAIGKYLVRMDADDVCASNRFDVLFSFMEKNSSVDVCGSYVTRFSDESVGKLMSYPISDVAIKAEMVFGSPLAHPAVIMRRSALVRYLPLYEEFKHAEDYALWVKLSDFVEFSNVPISLLYYRIHDSSVSKKHSSVQKRSRLSVWKSILSKMECSSSDSDLETHSWLSDVKQGLNLAHIQKLQRWILMLKRANSSSGYSDEREFEKVIAKRWCRLILKANIRKVDKIRLIASSKYSVPMLIGFPFLVSIIFQN